jgi:hypothetical protein
MPTKIPCSRLPRGALPCQPFAETAHSQAPDSLKQEIEEWICEAADARELEACLVGDAGSAGSRNECDLVDRAK